MHFSGFKKCIKDLVIFFAAKTTSFQSCLCLDPEKVYTKHKENGVVTTHKSMSKSKQNFFFVQTRKRAASFCNWLYFCSAIRPLKKQWILPWWGAKWCCWNVVDAWGPTAAVWGNRGPEAAAAAALLPPGWSEAKALNGVYRPPVAVVLLRLPPEESFCTWKNTNEYESLETRRISLFFQDDKKCRKCKM